MKKAFVGLAALFCLAGLTGCKNGVEKEYTMEIKEAPIVARLQEDESKEVIVAYCKRGASLLNYYIELPEMEEGFEMPKTLVAKDTSENLKTIIINEKGKSEKVTDHGYKFVKWGE